MNNEMHLHKLEKYDRIYIYDIGKKIIKGKIKVGNYLYLKNNDGKMYTYGNENDEKFLIARKYSLLERIKFSTKPEFKIKKLLQSLYANLIDIIYLGK